MKPSNPDVVRLAGLVAGRVDNDTPYRLTIKDASKILGVDSRQVKRLCNRLSLVVVRKGGDYFILASWQLRSKPELV